MTTSKSTKFITLRITPQLFEAVQRAAAAEQWRTGQRCSVNVLAAKYIEDGLKIDEYYLNRNEQRETPYKTARPEWVLTADIKSHNTTLRVDSDLHLAISKMTSGLHLATGTPTSINTLVTRYLVEGINRDTNPKIISDLAELNRAKEAAK